MQHSFGAGMNLVGHGTIHTMRCFSCATGFEMDKKAFAHIFETSESAKVDAHFSLLHDL